MFRVVLLMEVPLVCRILYHESCNPLRAFHLSILINLVCEWRSAHPGAGWSGAIVLTPVADAECGGEKLVEFGIVHFA